MRSLWQVLVSAVFLVCGPVLAHGQTLAWDANPETDIAGYRVFYGTQSGNYPNKVDVGKQTQYTPPSGFDWTKTQYFAVQAYNTSGLSSPMSAELQWVPPAPPPPPAPPTITSIVASTSYPLNAGQPVTWTATAPSNPSPLEYRFYLYKKTAWVMAQDYGPSNKLTWTPSGADNGGPYSLQVWVRRVGVTSPYEGWLSTPTFTVSGAALELMADVDFPTPPGNHVRWTALAAFPYEGTLQYQFLVANEADGVFTVFRDYAASATAQWTPAAAGQYAVQARARQVGSTAAFEYIGTTAYFSVSQAALSVTSLTADLLGPAPVGTKITWTARAKGGSAGPLQYQFWLHSVATGWKIGQPFGSSPSFVWTPTWGEHGDYTVQVWVRNNGSTASYEAWRSSTSLTVTPAPMTLTTPSLFPAPPGSHIDWTADWSGAPGPVEYKFDVCSVGGFAACSTARPYHTSPAFRWIPATTGQYTVRAYARQVGSGADLEAARWTDLVNITQEPAQVLSITSNRTLPVAPGTSVTWAALAQGGTAGPLQYQFWRWSNGSWVLAQPYSSSNTYTWTPSASDIGEHALQVWVRSAGSTASYEAYRSTGNFWVK